ncbi:MAG TPA: cytochrome P450 [Candidatus Lustribacter sp.]|nr:cytochrome P450 [Candidatus Lustribacter sp.]
MRRYPAGPGPFEAFRGMLPARGMTGFPVFFRRTAQRYGPIASSRVGAQRFYYVSEPAAIEELLVTNGRAYVKGRGTQRLERLLGKGLLTSNGAFHLRQRRLVQPAFHRERIASYAAAMVARAEAFADRVIPGERVEMDEAMSRLTLGITAETLFGADVDDDADTIGRAMHEAMVSFPISLTPIGELLDHLPMVPVVRKFLAARAELDAVVYRLIDERRAHPTDRPDVLGMLLVAGEGPDGMDVEQIRDEAMTIFLAGYETTARALTWTWWLLSQHPAAAALLADELATVLGGRLPGMDDVPNLRYTRDLIAESMRLYPPAWVVGRRAAEPTTLGPWQVPKGAIVLASQWITHHDPRFWREPEDFRPERWSNGETAGQPKFAYFPFGGGTRTCIGEPFAWTELVLVLATIARRRRFAAAPGLTSLGAQPSVTLRPAGPVPMVARSA